MFCDSPISENMPKIMLIVRTMAMTPNISGTSKRVITRLLTRRITVPSPWPARVQMPAPNTRCFNVRGARSAIKRENVDVQYLVSHTSYQEAG
jgi:hypothetical protein